MNLSVLVHENDGPHIYIYTLLHVSARSEGDCDKFSILGASFTDFRRGLLSLYDRYGILLIFLRKPHRGRG